MSLPASSTCPMCGESLTGQPERCPACGERLSGAEIAEDFWIDPKLVRLFHSQTRWLSGLWIFFGTLPILYGLYWIFDIFSAKEQFLGDVVFWLIVFGVSSILPGMVLIILGLIVRRKKQICLVVSLLAGYFLLLFCVATGSTVPVIAGLLTVVMSHACFHTADQMRKLGIPLDTPIPQ